MKTTITTTVSETLEDLSRYNSNDLRLFATPGGVAPYWSDSPQFMYDMAIATVDDFADAAGYESGFCFEDEEMQRYMSESGGSETYSLEVELPGGRDL